MFACKVRVVKTGNSGIIREQMHNENMRIKIEKYNRNSKRKKKQGSGPKCLENLKTLISKFINV